MPCGIMVGGTRRGSGITLAAEKLGGGGNVNSAGAQFEHTNVKEAIEALKVTIDQMIEEGDI